MLPTLCRDCLTHINTDAQICATRGSTRLVRHAELDEPSSNNSKQTAQSVLSAISSADELLADIINTPGVGVLVHRDNKILFANKTFTDMNRMSEEEIEDGTLSARIIETRRLEADVYSATTVQVANDLSVEGEFEAIVERTDGSRYWVKINTKNITWQGKPARLNISSSIDMRIRIEEELIATQAQLKQANQAKSEFLAQMSHELRTPLNAIIGFSELMSSGIGGEVAENHIEYLRDINQSGLHLLSLIIDVLDLSKIEAGKLELYEENFNLGDEIRRGLVFVREQARNSKIRIFEDFQDDCPDIHGDRRLVLQIVVNLLTNAIKYNVEDGEMRIDGGISETGCPWFSVADTGVGIAEDEIENVLNPYSRTGDQDSTEGTGLGLLLVSKMAELHDADVALTSTLGVGTSVCVTFPADRLAAS